MSKKVVTDIVNCGRCGGRHNNLKLKAFTRPITDDRIGDELLYSHFGTCPRMGQPILALVTETDE